MMLDILVQFVLPIIIACIGVYKTKSARKSQGEFNRFLQKKLEKCELEKKELIEQIIEEKDDTKE